MLLEKTSLFERRNRERMVVGYDLNDYAAQISFCTLEGEEPETVAVVPASEVYNIPVVLYKRPDVNQWFYGRDAIKNAREEDGTLIQNLVTLAREGNPVIVEEREFDPIALLALYMKRSLSLLQNIVPLERVEAIMITVDNLDHRMVEVLGEIVETLKLKQIKIMFQSHMESFYYYTIHQPKELWKTQVIACDYCGKMLKTYRFECNNKTTPIVAFIDEQEFPEMKGGKLDKDDLLYAEEAAKRDATFGAIMGDIMSGRYISSIFLLGEGFDGDWCTDSLRFLCRNNRRVFRGNNLFSKGACLAAREKISLSEQGKNYVFLGNDKLKSNIGMKILRRGRESYVALLDAGVNWFDAKGSCEFILESGNSFQLLITPLNGKNPTEVEIPLSDLPNRPNKTTRLHLDMKLLDENTAYVSIKDLGFGELFPSSGLVWNEKFEV